ncbi:DUF3263 domain-containing protein [Rhodococcus wratislaviensis]|uniref:DUF3263 domain-containing protein n=1 Tax=Rhodococcus wratislaviensis NBRC 100605 TaxID=1219028 RepID=X0QF90_RHOWR|nr:DUF3263 domain-containing protein [Rhodococcus wratislaviensis]GAF50242.1 hypothetical protein RW1_094_02830 [Rhodococcus wratislaviensis NBRC 100605]
MSKPAAPKSSHGSDRDRESSELVAFAAKWQPFGGAAAGEILVHFGLTPRRYYLRLGHVLDFFDPGQLGVTPETHQLIRQLCWQRVEAHEAAEVRATIVDPS